MWLLIIAVLLVSFVIKIVKVSRYWKGRGIAYEPFYHYLYRILWILNTRGNHEFQSIAVKRYGRVFGSYKGFTPTLMTADVKIAKDVLIKQFDKFFKRSIEFASGDPIWDHNLMNLPYDQWKTMRSAMGYAFTSAKMKNMIKKFDVIGKRLVRKLIKTVESNGGHVDTEFIKYAKMYAVDSTLVIAYGKDVNCIENPDSPFLKYTTSAVATGVANFLFFVAPNLFRYVPGVSFPPKKTTEFFSQVAEQVFKEKRAKLDEAVANGTADIIDRQLLLQREDPSLTDELLTSQAFLFMVAAIDPTALAIIITTYYLSLFPDAQRRAFEEVKSCLGNRDEVCHEDIQEMKYLEGCVFESFRMFPMVGQLDRICNEDTTVQGIPIEKGVKVEFATHEMMQDPNYFPEPEKFQPERFVKDQSSHQQELGAFLVFGDGPKHCAGKRLGVMNSVTVLANLILRLEFEACAETPAHPPKMRPGFDFEHMTCKPLVIRVKPRN